MEDKLRILYAIQGTGNGHVARALEIVPILQKFGSVSIALSGSQSQVKLPFKIDYYSKGLTFKYNGSGGISYFKTLLANNLLKLYKEVKSFPVQEFDLVINDFEFTTAWACKLKKKTCFALGHQASFISKSVPRPVKKQFLGELILKYYAPATHHIGFHFDTFSKGVFTPVIRSDIRHIKPQNKGHYTVYLPAYSDEILYEHLHKIDMVQWQVFSKHTSKDYTKDNVHFVAVDNQKFIKSFSHCEGVLTSAGFETPAEALFLGKKLFVIPIQNQYEQYCNAAALAQLNIPTVDKLNLKTIGKIKQWVEDGKPLKVLYPNETQSVIEKNIIQVFKKRT